MDAAADVGVGVGASVGAGVGAGAGVDVGSGVTVSVVPCAGAGMDAAVVDKGEVKGRVADGGEQCNGILVRGVIRGERRARG